jgi:hypothetical protein
MARRHSSGGWGVLGLLLLLGLVIQVVKLLVVPLTILAIGAVVIVPIYLVVTHAKAKELDRPPPTVAPEPEPVDDGIVSRDAVLKFLPSDVVTAVTQGQQPGNEANSDAPLRSAPEPEPEPERGTPSAEPWPTAYRHGSCPVKHRTYEAARRCRRG